MRLLSVRGLRIGVRLRKKTFAKEIFVIMFMVCNYRGDDTVKTKISLVMFAERAKEMTPLSRSMRIILV